MNLRKVIFWVILVSFFFLLPVVQKAYAQDDSYSDGGYSASYYSDNSSVSLGSDQAYSADQLGGCCSNGGSYGDTPYGDNGVGYGDSGSGYSDSGSSGGGYTDNGAGYQDSGGGSGCVSGGYYNNYGRTYYDNNRNSSFDTGDTPLPNQTIQLVHLSSGAIWATATSNASGNYTIISEANQLLGIRHATALPAGAVRINPTYDTINVVGNCPRSYSFGIASNTPPAQLSPPPNFTVLQTYCNGATSRVHLEWTQTTGATSFRIYRRPLGNPTHVQIGEVGPGTGYNDDTVTPGGQYNYFIQAVNGSTTLSGNNQDIAVVSNCSAPPPSAPGAFGHQTYSTSCPLPNAPQVTISWTAAQNAASYRVYWLDSAVGTMQPPGGIPIGNVTSYTLNGSNGLTPGHSYGFVVAAENAYGSSFTNQTPYNPVAPGGWSHYIYGWALFPTCAGPGPFNFTQQPTPACAGVGSSYIQTSWSAAADATSYVIYPQSNVRGWLYNATGGLPPTAFGAWGGYIQHTIPPPIPTGEGWEYTVYATNAYGVSTTPTGSTYYTYGSYWAPAANCDNPVVTLLIDGSEVIKTIGSGSSITLNYWANNTYTLTTSSNQVIPPTAAWRNIYPSNTSVVDPWSTYGAVTLTLYNNTTYPVSSYQFTLHGVNNRLSGSPSQSKTVTVNVVAEKAPFIQTTQGDVHSNQDISVPE